MGTNIFFPCEFDPFFENFKLANNLWTVCARVLIFHKSIPLMRALTFYVSFPYDKTFSWFHYCLPCDLGLGIWPIFWKLNLTNIFKTVSSRGLIFHVSVRCDKTFPWIPLFMTMWPWPRSFTHFLKILTLLITFEQWVLEFWYFTWVILVIS